MYKCAYHFPANLDVHLVYFTFLGSTQLNVPSNACLDE